MYYGYRGDKMKLAFFDTKEYDRVSFDKVNNGKYDITYFNVLLSIDTVILAKGYDAVCAFVNDKIDKEVLDKLNEYNIHVLVLRCAGYNNVDVKSAYKKVHILTVPGYAPEAIAEHGFALILSLVRHIHKSYNRVRDFNFSLNGLTGFNLNGKTIGIIGTGKIGKVMINIANGYGMKVLAYDLFPNHNLNCSYVSLDELFRSSDIISLHAPLTSDNYHLINKEAINKMKDGVIIINTSRGGLIDSNALLEGLKNKHIGAAGLDVYEEESDVFFVDKSLEGITDDTLSLLISMPNVILTSHQAYLTKEALEEIAKTTIDNLDKALNGEYSPNEVCYMCKNKNDLNACLKVRNKSCW